MGLRRPSAQGAGPLRRHMGGTVGLEAFLRGCRCASCHHAHQRAQRWVEWRTIGATVREVVERDEGDPTEAEVRHATRLLTRHDQAVPWLARVEKEALERVAQAAKRNGKLCVTCERPMGPHESRRRYHAGDCERVGKALRYHVDDDSRQATQARKHRHTIRTQPGTPQAEAAQRALDSPTPQRERNLHRGSAAWHAAIDAYRQGWPIFDRLPERIRDIATEAARKLDRP